MDIKVSWLSLHALVVAAGEKGATSKELVKALGVHHRTFENWVQRLTSEGMLFSGGFGTSTRRFAKREWADKHSDANPRGYSRDEVLKIITAAGADGISTPEIAESLGCAMSQISHALTELRSAGKSFSAGKNHTYRNFASFEDAEAYRVKRAEARLEHKRIHQPEYKRRSKAKLRPIAEAMRQQRAAEREARKNDDAAWLERRKKRAEKRREKSGKEMLVKRAEISTKRAEPKPARPEEIIIPDNVKITKAETKPGRYEVTGPVIGGFATAGIGQYIGPSRFSAYLEKQ